MTDISFNIAELNSELLVWEKVYNTVRNHSATLRLKEVLECYKQMIERRCCVTKVSEREQAIDKLFHGDIT